MAHRMMLALTDMVVNAISRARRCDGVIRARRSRWRMFATAVCSQYDIFAPSTTIGASCALRGVRASRVRQ